MKLMYKLILEVSLWYNCVILNKYILVYNFLEFYILIMNKYVNICLIYLMF